MRFNRVYFATVFIQVLWCQITINKIDIIFVFHSQFEYICFFI